ncbi:MAG: hypothetical protein AAF611_16715 [Bacteroidota bacterium]
MKKRNLSSLVLNKKSISKLGTQNGIVGGFNTESCEPNGICPAETDDCGTQNNCGTGGTSGLQVTCAGTCACGPTISCPKAGIC